MGCTFFKFGLTITRVFTLPSPSTTHTHSHARVQLHTSLIRPKLSQHRSWITHFVDDTQDGAVSKHWGCSREVVCNHLCLLRTIRLEGKSWVLLSSRVSGRRPSSVWKVTSVACPYPTWPTFLTSSRHVHPVTHCRKSWYFANLFMALDPLRSNAELGWLSWSLWFITYIILSSLIPYSITIFVSSCHNGQRLQPSNYNFTIVTCLQLIN